MKPFTPMPLTPIQHPFDDDGFFFENKWDGFRCLTFLQGGSISLKSRNLRDITGKYPELMSLSDFLKEKDLILDGEICSLDERGHPDFSRMQRSFLLQNPAAIKKRAQEEPVTYIVWDLLYKRGEDLRPRPLHQRRQFLDAVVSEGPHLFISEAVSGRGKDLFTAVKEEGLEGMVAKKRNSPYLSRTNSYWLKIKCYQFIDAVIGGFTEKKKTLLLGEAGEKGLLFLGRVSPALKEEDRFFLYQLLAKYRSTCSPFLPPPPPGKNQWVRPVIHCRVKYLERTRGKRLRQAHISSIKEERWPCI